MGEKYVTLLRSEFLEGKMSNIEVKRFLRRYEQNTKKIDVLRTALDEKRSRLYSVSSPKLTGMPRGGVYKTKEDLVAEIENIERRLSRAIKKGQTIKLEILDVIDEVADAKYCRILELYYIEFKTLEQIAEEMNYSYRWIVDLYHQAIQAVVLPYAEGRD